VKDYILTLLVAAAVTYVTTPLVRRAAVRFGAMHAPRERDVHTVPVPRGGGVAMYLGLAAGLFVAEQIPQLRSAFGSTGMVQGLLLAGGLLVAIGVVDDRWGMSALTKAAGQVAAGAILVATGTQLNWLPEPGGGTFAPTPDQSTLLTILVVVATINAVNFIDGLDGLAAGFVAIAAVSFLIYYYGMTKVLSISALAAPALASAILTGVCLGFLPHNFHPARIFMGDTGSMLLGLVLAYAPISSITSLDPADLSEVNRYPVIMPLLLPAVLLVIPYTDMLLAVIRRMRAGLSPFAADQKHLHHRLIGIGHSQRASVLFMYLWAALFSGSVVWFSLEKTAGHGLANHHGQPVLVFVLITAAAVIALVLMSLPWLRNRDRPPRAVGAPAPGAPGTPSIAGTLRPAAARRASAPAAARDGSDSALAPDPPDLAVSVADGPRPADVEEGRSGPPDLMDAAFGPASAGGTGTAPGAAGRRPAAADPVWPAPVEPAGRAPSESAGYAPPGPASRAPSGPASRAPSESAGHAPPGPASRAPAEPAGHAAVESARHARSVVGTVPPAIDPDSQPAPADRVGSNGLVRGQPLDQAAWPGRSKAGSLPPATIGEDLAEPLPRRARAETGSYPAGPGGIARLVGRGQHSSQTESGLPVVDPGEVQH
jgi:UDP-GlcNAc:undecaprenyl-phosphate/decaprenyl-phosphate GlcNAc-1-phosphate transferase